MDQVQTPVEESPKDIQPQIEQIPEQLKAAGFNTYEDVVNFKQQAEAWKPVNPLIEKLNTLYRDGVPQEQIDSYLQLQSIDLQKMDHSGVVKMQLQMQRPDLSDYELEVMMEDKFGAKPTLEDYEGDERAEEKLNAALKRYEAKVKIFAGEARQFLQSQKVKVDTDLFAQKDQERERRATLTDAYQSVAMELIKTATEIDLGFEDESGKLELKYNLRLSEQEKVQMSKMVARWAIESKIDLATKEGLQQAQGFYENYLIGANPQRRAEMNKAIAKEVEAGVMAAVKKQYSLK